jgi:endonuclease G
MKNLTLAAIPLALALIGGNVITTPDVLRLMNVRIAASEMSRPITIEELTEEEQVWLKEHNPFGIPKAEIPGIRKLISRQGYTLAHNTVDLIADWVAFHLTREYVEGKEKRPGSSAFKPDPKLPVGRRAELTDYKGWNGVYDRGHQCASADSKGRGNKVIRDSFYLSNMTPQASKLNRNKWRLLEAKIQKIAIHKGELWIITGPVFVDQDKDGLVEYYVIGKNKVAVPTHYYKIVVAKSKESNEEFKAMALLIPNEEIKNEYNEYLISIDEIERLTGLDFFSEMPDHQEERLEAATSDNIWKIE